MNINNKDKDRASTKEKFSQMIRIWVDQFAHTLQSTDTKEFIQVLILDPFMKYIIDRLFPYIIIALCLVAVVIICVVVILLLLLFKPPITSIQNSSFT